MMKYLAKNNLRKNVFVLVFSFTFHHRQKDIAGTGSRLVPVFPVRKQRRLNVHTHLVS